MKSQLTKEAGHAKSILHFVRRICGRSRRPARINDADDWSRLEHYRDFTQEQLSYLEPKIAYHRDLWRLY